MIPIFGAFLEYGAALTKIEEAKNLHDGQSRSRLVRTIMDLIEHCLTGDLTIAEELFLFGNSEEVNDQFVGNREELMRAVAREAMKLLRHEMDLALTLYPYGTTEAVVGLATAYIAFARQRPTAFRLMFGLIEGYLEGNELAGGDDGCFPIVLSAVAAISNSSPDHPDVYVRAILLWGCVHGHLLATIDRRRVNEASATDELGTLSTMISSILSISLQEE